MTEKMPLENDEIEMKKRVNQDFMTIKSGLITQKNTAVLQYGPNSTPFLVKTLFNMVQNEERFRQKRGRIWAILQGKCL